MEKVDVLGVRKDGSTQIVGQTAMPPAMKMHEIVRDLFGEPAAGPLDFDEAGMCLHALETYHAWLLEQGWTPPPVVITSNT